MKNLITLYIGMFDKDTKKQEYPIENFIKILDSYFDYYTLTQSQGRYKHEDGTIINEPTLKVEVLLDNLSHNSIFNIVELIKDRLNQECIMVTTQTLYVDFM